MALIVIGDSPKLAYHFKIVFPRFLASQFSRADFSTSIFLPILIEGKQVENELIFGKLENSDFSSRQFTLVLPQKLCYNSLYLVFVQYFCYNKLLYYFTNRKEYLMQFTNELTCEVNIATQPQQLDIFTATLVNIPLYQENSTPDLANLLNRVFEADCLEKMKDIPSKSIDMILCDLPYGMTQNAWDSYIPL
ncbi:MAG: hypothetical protein LBI54_07505, partial [Lachnospiraceae bacterium]|nr:hypothetical protein [Lachnospiraceae bacterium]